MTIAALISLIPYEQPPHVPQCYVFAPYRAREERAEAGNSRISCSGGRPIAK